MKILALIINILGFPAILFSAAMAIMSPMMFDAPDSTESKSLWYLMICFVLLPLLSIIGEIWGWKYYLAQDFSNAILAYKWALLDILIIIILLFFAGQF